MNNKEWIKWLEKWFNENPSCYKWKKFHCPSCEYKLFCKMFEKMLRKARYVSSK